MSKMTMAMDVDAMLPKIAMSMCCNVSVNKNRH